MTIGSTYGNTFQAWRTGAGQAWSDYARHAFVEGLRTGELPRASFLHYLVQDYVFLVHFSRAWSLAVVKAETLEEMKVCAGTVDALVNHEMGPARPYLCRAGNQRRCAVQTRRRKTQILPTRDTSWMRVYRATFWIWMAALAPCVMGYGEIGQRLGSSATAGTPYQDWIDTYAGAEYQDLCATVGAMIDTAAARRLGDDPGSSPRWDRPSGALHQSDKAGSRVLVHGASTLSERDWARLSPGSWHQKRPQYRQPLPRGVPRGNSGYRRNRPPSRFLRVPARSQRRHRPGR